MMTANLQEGQNQLPYNRDGLIIGVVLGGAVLIAIAIAVPVCVIKRKIKALKAAQVPKAMVANVVEQDGDLIVN